MQLTERYNEAFYRAQMSGSRRSAEVILPFVLEQIGTPISVVDVGCGAGTWLEVLSGLGVNELVGVDGGDVGSVGHSPSLVTRIGRDLEQPLDLNRRFDLCVSLEVAEHLSVGRALGFVEDLCSLSDVVLFSAAVPGQGGEHHINEQWQGYWAQHFRSCGFEPVDTIRPRVWGDGRVDWWYAQNVLLYVKGRRKKGKNAKKKSTPSISTPWSANVVHPRAFLEHTAREASLETDNARLWQSLAEERASRVHLLERLVSIKPAWEEGQDADVWLTSTASELCRLYEVEDQLRQVHSSRTWRWSQWLRHLSRRLGLNRGPRTTQTHFNDPAGVELP